MNRNEKNQEFDKIVSDGQLHDENDCFTLITMKLALPLMVCII